MLHKYEIGFESRIMSMYFGKYLMAYYKEEDIGKIYLFIKIFSKMFCIFECHNKYLDKVLAKLLKKKLKYGR